MKKSKLLALLLLLPVVMLTGCIYPYYLGTFGKDLTSDIRRSMGPELTYETSNRGVPPVLPNMRLHQLPEHGGTMFYLNCQCEDATVQITAGREDIGYDHEGGRFWIRNTHQGGLRRVIVEVNCPGDPDPWILPFYIQSSGPLIRR